MLHTTLTLLHVSTYIHTCGTAHLDSPLTVGPSAVDSVELVHFSLYCAVFAVSAPRSFHFSLSLHQLVRLFQSAATMQSSHRGCSLLQTCHFPFTDVELDNNQKNKQTAKALSTPLPFPLLC